MFIAENTRFWSQIRFSVIKKEKNCIFCVSVYTIALQRKTLLIFFIYGGMTATKKTPWSVNGFNQVTCIVEICRIKSYSLSFFHFACLQARPILILYWARIFLLYKFHLQLYLSKLISFSAIFESNIKLCKKKRRHSQSHVTLLFVKLCITLNVHLFKANFRFPLLF